jgi:hypothetical protein
MMTNISVGGTLHRQLGSLPESEKNGSLLTDKRQLSPPNHKDTEEITEVSRISELISTLIIPG